MTTAAKLLKIGRFRTSHIIFILLANWGSLSNSEKASQPLLGGHRQEMAQSQCIFTIFCILAFGSLPIGHDIKRRRTWDRFFHPLQAACPSTYRHAVAHNEESHSQQEHATKIGLRGSRNSRQQAGARNLGVRRWCGASRKCGGRSRWLGDRSRGGMAVWEAWHWGAGGWQRHSNGGVGWPGGRALWRRGKQQQKIKYTKKTYKIYIYIYLHFIYIYIYVTFILYIYMYKKNTRNYLQILKRHFTQEEVEWKMA